MAHTVGHPAEEEEETTPPPVDDSYSFLDSLLNPQSIQDFDTTGMTQNQIWEEEFNRDPLTRLGGIGAAIGLPRDLWHAGWGLGEAIAGIGSNVPNPGVISGPVANTYGPPPGFYGPEAAPVEPQGDAQLEAILSALFGQGGAPSQGVNPELQSGGMGGQPVQRAPVDPYAQSFDLMEQQARDQYQMTIDAQQGLTAAQQQYLASMGGGGSGYGFYDDQFARATSFLDSREQQLLADIAEMEQLKQSGVSEAAVRQRALYDELELVRGQRLQADQQAMVAQLGQMETQRRGYEQQAFNDISARTAGVTQGQRDRRGVSEQRLRDANVDPSLLGVDETQAVLDAQANRQQTYSQRMAQVAEQGAAGRSASVSNAYNDARMFLADQLFAGRAGTDEEEAALMQIIAEQVLGSRQQIGLESSEGRFAAGEQRAEGYRKADASAAAAASKRAAAELGFAQSQAEAQFAANSELSAQLNAIELARIDQKISEEEAAKLKAAAQASNDRMFQAARLGLSYGDDPELSAIANSVLTQETGNTGFITSALSRSQTLADEEFNRDISIDAGSLLAAQLGLNGGQVSGLQESGMLNAYIGQQGGNDIPWSDLYASGITPDEVSEYIQNNPMLASLSEEALREALRANILQSGQ